MKKKVLTQALGVAIVAGLGVFVFWPSALHEARNYVLDSSAEEETSVSVLFVGDIMLDRAVAQHAHAKGDHVLFQGVETLLQDADLTIGNLEGSITTELSVSEKDPKILKFTFSPRFATLLKDLGFDALSLANNHALDFGADGYTQTQRFLGQAGISAFGHPLNNRQLSTMLVVHDTTFCFIGYHSLFDPESAWVAAEIKKLRPQCSYVIVFAHWGEEYWHEPTTHQKQMAHLFIDLGADLVIGAHPHVVQPVEVYRNRAIFYSLGNFLFDQNFQPEVRRGVAVRTEFASSTTRFTLTPVVTFKEVSVADATTTAAVLQDLEVENLSFDLVQ